jgi:hypothetical protein
MQTTDTLCLTVWVHKPTSDYSLRPILLFDTSFYMTEFGTRLFLQVTKIQFDQIRDVSFTGLY